MKTVFVVKLSDAFDGSLFGFPLKGQLGRWRIPQPIQLKRLCEAHGARFSHPFLAAGFIRWPFDGPESVLC